MKYRQLFNLDLAISEIGLGCASYWGKKIFSESQAIAVVHSALENGVNYFDTGHSYSGGHAETRLGKALKSFGVIDSIDNKAPIISSKVGTRLGHWGRVYKDFSTAWIQQSCEQSLRSLQLDYLPIFFLHGPNPEDFNDEVFLALSQLKQAGKVGLVGVNSFCDEILDMAVECGQFQCVMLDYNILTQHRIRTINHLNEKRIDVMVAGAIAGGLYDHRFKQFKGIKSLWYWLRAIKNNRTLLSKAKTFEFLNHQGTNSAIQLALAFVLQNKQFSSALVGTTSVEHLDELLKSDELILEADLIQKIQSF